MEIVFRHYCVFQLSFGHFHSFIMPKTRKADYSDRDPQVRTRGPIQRVNYDFQVRKIQSEVVKVKDVLGHLVLEKRSNEKEKTSVFAKRVAQHIMENTPRSGKLLSERRISVKIENLWSKYVRLMKRPDDYRESRQQWYEEAFSYLQVSVPSAQPRPVESELTMMESPIHEANDVTTADSQRADSPGSPAMPSTSQQQRNMTDISVPCEIALRFGVDPSKTAAISTATLVAHKLVSKDNTKYIIDRQKVKRQTDKLIEKVKNEGFQEFVVMNNIYFDSKKAIIGREKENLYVFVTEPNGQFVFCESNPGEDAEAAFNMILTSFSKRGLMLQRVYLVGVDGTNVNTGHANGIIRMLEVHLEHPVQWIVCLLHTNELPLRKLFLHVDGVTTGPSSYSGPLGKLFVQKGHLNQLPVVPFLPVKCRMLPDIDREVLSKDQQHLYDLAQAIERGKVPTNVSNRILGTVHHARFLNLASSILRYYVSKPSPSVKLKALVQYVMQVYVPTFFLTKTHSKIYHGAQNLFCLFEGLKQMTHEHYELLLPIVLNNSYFWHPENLLLAMLVDDDQVIRKLAVETIVAARNSPIHDGVRVFRKLKRSQINEDATAYHQIIKWQTVEVTSPPILESVSNSMLFRTYNDPDELKRYLNYCNHTQAVERGIKDLQFVAARHPPEDRDAVLKLIRANRKKMGSFRTKNEYNVFEAGVLESIHDPPLDEQIIDEETAEENCISDTGSITDSDSDSD